MDKSLSMMIKEPCRSFYRVFIMLKRGESNAEKT
nr:MAG TPA: hypothetical protein [Caudoviricetes sp.]